ncbi:MAG: tRNA (adenosine(37)-N6)-threonylcarbamoyltransferase complex transferase subunit TsaD [Bacilli bacterium]|nr:tRNA (adenosine(37)-N6)-threonylcarbamoyltransferase complex transferase subunit TsaD [Bacilli bacterium]MDD4077134.1 tRNA (adenosine(37)-N6)-threonylcarbamoyltransferase complex transferase subunit TsaD [Bacilli bacterium]MDD4388040.1 tRNA (adenosine(37)-N6)-threonylcarbamoyltransferase complex transferase subunit TsaD [Bacilli bacterium]
MLVLGIETSCDETAVAIVKDGKAVLANVVYSQIDIHKEYGGVVPEVASRNHARKITLVLEEAFRKAKKSLSDIDLVAVTHHPGLIGSLLVGINGAKALSMAYNIPYVEVNHIHGHIYANYLEDDFRFPLLALVVSGGHTELVLMRQHLDFYLLGQTLDDAVGETYDKVGRVLGLDYPAGPALDKLALSGEINYNLPLIYLDKDKYHFSFSGLKTAVLNLVNTKKMQNEAISFTDLAASFQNSVIRVLVDKTVAAAKEFKVKQVVVAGGVAANRGLRSAMKNEVSKLNDVVLTFPSLYYCTDNAAMIAVAGYFQYNTK